MQQFVANMGEYCVSTSLVLLHPDGTDITGSCESSINSLNLSVVICVSQSFISCVVR